MPTRSDRERFVIPESEPKQPGSPDRSVSIAQTLANVPALRRRYGITRVGDLSALDRARIPVTCAVVPTSEIITIFNGKGTTPEAALVGAVMEAVERCVVAAPTVETHRRSVRAVCAFVDLNSLGLLPGKLDTIVDCTWGTDLCDGSQIALPMQLVTCPWRGERLFPITTSNGLASGNTPLEALYHALLEMIERHVWSLASVRSELVPRFYRAEIDRADAARLMIPSGDETVDDLAERIARAGLELQVMILIEGTLPTVALATIVEPGSQPPMAHQGLGCSLSPRHAVARAITEAMQSRVVDIAGARDDLLRLSDPPRSTGEHGRRVAALPVDRWFFGLPAPGMELNSISDRASDDLAADVRLLIQLLRDEGLGPIVAVDISDSDSPACVVRVVAPALETTSLDGRLRKKARALFNPFRLGRHSLTPVR
jgi:ribosomal protein S12 methylthiotransferase accessory factor